MAVTGQGPALSSKNSCSADWMNMPDQKESGRWRKPNTSIPKTYIALAIFCSSHIINVQLSLETMSQETSDYWFWLRYIERHGIT